MKIILASQNKGKVREIKSIFENSPFEIISLYDLGNNIEIEETGSTFSENAFIKAKAIFEHYKEPSIADDSGIMVEQLDGRPGVISARYAGPNCTFEDNNLKLIKELSNYPEPHKAKFVCTAVFYDGRFTIETVGEINGIVINEQRGTEGFGYDPIFIPDGYNKTMAELNFEEKNKISHRAIAFKKLLEKLKSYYGL
ncbi:RdgB/HAM1 family non-canonical purine NTP pyrophosphatase [Ignavibacteria bacterium 4148-Me]|uniref:RdgB/HAM1 family non-canonical purine NTP pyrophosphatase n=1 Tax=Rosettibacter primus TaxID=3111523 RepID=UPI00336C12EF